jgi:phytanoyl-CoA hydroxylase
MEVVDISQIQDLLIRLRKHSFDVFNQFSNFYIGKPVKSEDDLINFRTNSQKEQWQALKHLQFSAPIFELAGHPIFYGLLKSRYGFGLPGLDLPPFMRCDIPIKDQSLFNQHQDYSYNIGSSNSLSIWIPLQDTSVSEGALLCSAGSHLSGVYENSNGIINDRYVFDFKHVPVKFGEALILDQKLVHKSGVNVSGNIRFSVILRFSDLCDMDYLLRGCPINHEITTIKYAMS